MADSFATRLSERVDRHGPLCVGIDPSGAVVGQWERADDVEGLEYVARSTLEAAVDTAAAVKVQVAFFERFGSSGYRVLERVLSEAHGASLLVIADAKRGDVGSSSVGYAEAWLTDRSPLAVDAVTASPFLGVGSLAPLLSQAHQTGRAVFVLAATSNDEGRVVQGAITDDGVPVEVSVLRAVATLNERGGLAGAGGAVVGATRARPAFDLSQLGGPLLVPGVGAQGATVERVERLLRGVPRGTFLVNVGRAILERGPVRRELRDAVRRWRDDLAEVFP